jgi:hypothetical protein
MSQELIVKLPDVVQQVSISSAWIEERDQIVKASTAITAVTTKTDFEASGDLLKKITKTSKGLEELRKKISDPFRAAADLIKKTADNARLPLEIEKERIQRMMNGYAAEQARKQEEERKKIEAQQRKAIEEQQAKAEAEAEVFGEPEEIAPVVVPVIAPVEQKARADSVKVTETLEFTIKDAESVPRAFCSVDEVKIRGWMKMNKDRVTDMLKNNANKGGFIDGVEFRIETKVSAR